MELLTPIHSDIFFQEKLVLSGVDVKIRMTQSKEEFCLTRSDAVAYKISILTASLLVKKVSVSPAVRLGHAQALLSATEKYPIDRVYSKKCSMDGQQYPSKPLQPQYLTGSAVCEFYQLALASGRHLKKWIDMTSEKATHCINLISCQTKNAVNIYL